MLLAIHVLVPHRRFERRTPGFVGQYSIQNELVRRKNMLVRVDEIESPTLGFEDRCSVLLSYTRKKFLAECVGFEPTGRLSQPRLSKPPPWASRSTFPNSGRSGWDRTSA